MSTPLLIAVTTVWAVILLCAAALITVAVTERSARRWWDGAGPRSAFVAIALLVHPEPAAAHLLGDLLVQVAA